MAKVSVIIPCYNQGQYLKEAVDSVLASTFKDVEIVIVDDGSTVDVDLIDSVKGDNIKIIHQKNQGVCVARNNAIEAASGKYILPLDADDKIYPTYIEKAVKILDENANIGIVYCECEFFGAKTGKWDLEDYEFFRILVSNMIFCSGMYRKSDWQKVGGYNLVMDTGFEDWEFWISLVEKEIDVYKIPEILFQYRQYDNARTSSAEETRLILFKKIMKLHHETYIDNIEKVIIPLFHRFVLKNLKKELFSIRLKTRIFGKMLYVFMERK